MSRPAGSSIVTLELARMKACGLKQRREADVDIDASLTIMAEELAGYSEPVVRQACREWARTQVWWPSLSELRRECEEQARLEQDAETPKLQAPYRRQSTDEEIQAQCGWAVRWQQAGGNGKRVTAVKTDAGGKIVAIRRGPNSAWELPEVAGISA